MYLSTVVYSFAFLVGLCQCQFVALPNTNGSIVSEKLLISIARDYKPSLIECPLKHYKYGGKYLTSSAAFSYNFHHEFSHFAELPTDIDELVCNGVLVSDEWVLTTEKCSKVKSAKVGFDRHGKLQNFTEARVLKTEVKGDWALLQVEPLNFTGSVWSACLSNLSLTRTFWLDGTAIHSEERDTFSLKVFQDDFTFGVKSIPFISLDVPDFDSFIPWVEEVTQLDFSPKNCSSRYFDARRYEKYVAREGEEHMEYIIGLNALIQPARRRGYKASIYEDDKYKCGGVLITEKHVITAASCGIETGMTVQFMDYSENFTVVKIVTHPDFAASSLRNDLAMIELDGVVEFNDDIYPACIPDTPIESLGAPHRQTGLLEVQCGYSECYSDPVPQDRNTFLIISNVTDEKDCQKYYNLTVDPSQHFCSGNRERLVPGFCRNDHGGPIGRQIFYHNRYFNFVFGLNSHGQDCGCSFPTLATRLSAHASWIGSQAGFSPAKSTKDEEELLLSRSDSCGDLDLSNLESVIAGCNVIAFNETVFTVESCLKSLKRSKGYIAVDKQSIRQDSSVVALRTLHPEEASKLPTDCIWTKSEHVPAQSVIFHNDTLLPFFTHFSETCQSVYNITLASDEFCVESSWEWVYDELELMRGSTIWYSKKKGWEDQRAVLFGLVKWSRLTNEKTMLAVAVPITQAEVGKMLQAHSSAISDVFSFQALKV